MFGQIVKRVKEIKLEIEKCKKEIPNNDEEKEALRIKLTSMYDELDKILKQLKN